MSGKGTSVDRGGLRYLAVSGNACSKDIVSGVLHRRQIAPSERFLAQELQLTYLTVRQGLTCYSKRRLSGRNWAAAPT